MKKLVLMLALVLTVLLTSTTSVKAATATFTLLTPLPTHLAVGESYTIQVLVTSDEPFIWAMALSDEYYPGRGLFFHGNDRVSHDTSAVLSLTLTGKNSTADLPAVCDWPEPGTCWPAGTAPAAMGVGVRYPGGQVVSKQFAFAAAVP